MSKILDRALTINGDPIKVGSNYITPVLYHFDLVSQGYVTGAPTGGEAGFEKGCKLTRTDGNTTTTFYVNTGTATSATWTAILPTAFIGLTDVPATFSGQGSKLVRVNSGATALEFVTLTSELSALTGEVSLTVAALTAGDTHSGFRSVVGTLNANNSYGSAAYFESDITGTQAGEFHYVSGSWANINSGTVGAGKYICAQDNGVYEDASATITGAKVIYGMRMEAILGDTDALVFPFSSNNNNHPITAVFDVNNMTDLGEVTDAGVDSGKLVPFMRDAAGNIQYIKMYTHS